MKEYTLKYFKSMFIEDGEILIEDSKQWSDDPWFLEQENRNFINNIPKRKK